MELDPIKRPSLSDKDDPPVDGRSWPIDRKFGRASDYAAPLDIFQIVGLIVAAILGAVLLNIGAVIVALIFIARHLIDIMRRIARKVSASTREAAVSRDKMILSGREMQTKIVPSAPESKPMSLPPAK